MSPPILSVTFDDNFIQALYNQLQEKAVNYMMATDSAGGPGIYIAFDKGAVHALSQVLNGSTPVQPLTPGTTPRSHGQRQLRSHGSLLKSLPPPFPQNQNSASSSSEPSHAQQEEDKNPEASASPPHSDIAVENGMVPRASLGPTEDPPLTVPPGNSDRSEGTTETPAPEDGRELSRDDIADQDLGGDESIDWDALDWDQQTRTSPLATRGVSEIVPSQHDRQEVPQVVSDTVAGLEAGHDAVSDPDPPTIKVTNRIRDRLRKQPARIQRLKAREAKAIDKEMAKMDREEARESKAAERTKKRAYPDWEGADERPSKSSRLARPGDVGENGSHLGLSVLDEASRDDADNEESPEPPERSELLSSDIIDTHDGQAPSSDEQLLIISQQTSALQSKSSDDSADHTREPEEDNSALKWLANKMANSPDKELRATAYTTKREMVSKAKAIGGYKVMDEWKKLCMYWRVNGTLLGTHVEPMAAWDVTNPLENSAHLSACRKEFKAFYRAWVSAQQVDANKFLNGICLRQRAAHMYASYKAAEHKMADTPQETEGSREHDKTRAKRALFKVAHQWHYNLHDPRTNPNSSKEFKDFDKKLVAARRWLDLEKRFGTGFLAVIPLGIPNTWVEKTLKNSQFALWMELIEQINPEGLEVGRKITQLAYNAINGLPPPIKILKLEQIYQDGLKSVGYTPRLLDDAEEGVSTSGDESTQALQFRGDQNAGLGAYPVMTEETFNEIMRNI